MKCEIHDTPLVGYKTFLHCPVCTEIEAKKEHKLVLKLTFIFTLVVGVISFISYLLF